MNDPIAQGARAAARQLTAPAYPALAEDVEVALHTRESGTGRDREPGQYADPTAIGSLLVSIATLAWTVYIDLRSRTAAAPTPDTVSRHVRTHLDQDDTDSPQLAPSERNRIIDVTVDQVIEAARNADADQDEPPERPAD